MLSFIVRMTFGQDEHEEIAEMLRHLTLASRQEPGCMDYIAHFLEGDLSTVLIYERYVDEAALEQHRMTPHFHQYAIGGLYQRMRDRQVENLTAVC
ncbi:MAG: putative quinol monooxygenase [Edaphobacter sp.]